MCFGGIGIGDALKQGERFWKYCNVTHSCIHGYHFYCEHTSITLTPTAQKEKIPSCLHELFSLKSQESLDSVAVLFRKLLYVCMAKNLVSSLTIPIMWWHRRNRTSEKKAHSQKGDQKIKTTVGTGTWHIPCTCRRKSIDSWSWKWSEFWDQPIRGQPLILFSKVMSSVYCPPLSWFHLLREFPLSFSFMALSDLGNEEKAFYSIGLLTSSYFSKSTDLYIQMYASIYICVYVSGHRHINVRVCWKIFSIHWLGT